MNIRPWVARLEMMEKDNADIVLDFLEALSETGADIPSPGLLRKKLKARQTVGTGCAPSTDKGMVSGVNE